MNTISTQSSMVLPTLHTRLRDEMEAGIAASHDPENSGLPDLIVRTTTMYSPWYTPHLS